MTLSKFMMLFHLFFLLLGVLAVFLMAGNTISFDRLAFSTILITIFLNAVFGLLWASEVSKERVLKQGIPEPTKEPVPPKIPEIQRDYPMISFIVPAHNEERNIMRCINSLFRCALSYLGPSEIIIIDDGSTDATFEVAWTTINSKPLELTHIRTKVAKHMTYLGKTEAVKTGVNKAMGEYVAVVEAATPCDSAWLNEFVDYTVTTEKETENYYAHPSQKVTTTLLSTISLYRAETLRRHLNETQAESVT